MPYGTDGCYLLHTASEDVSVLRIPDTPMKVRLNSRWTSAAGCGTWGCWDTCSSSSSSCKMPLGYTEGEEEGRERERGEKTSARERERRNSFKNRGVISRTSFILCVYLCVFVWTDNERQLAAILTPAGRAGWAAPLWQCALSSSWTSTKFAFEIMKEETFLWSDAIWPSLRVSL